MSSGKCRPFCLGLNVLSLDMTVVNFPHDWLVPELLLLLFPNVLSFSSWSLWANRIPKIIIIIFKS